MTNADRRTAGIVGLGIMGGAIARNLVTAGWNVIGFDVDEARTREASAAGVTIARGPADIAAQAPVILTSLPHAEALRATTDEIIRAKAPKRVVAEVSTFALDDKIAAETSLRSAGHVMLDCPLSGTGAQARTKDLVVYASGDSGSIRSLMPLFADFAREAHDLGAFGNGTRMKLVANLLVAIHNVASAEAFALGIKAGLAPNQIFDLVRRGAGNSRVFELRGPMMVDGHYDDATMKISVWQKDMQVIGEFAKELGCQTPLFDAAKPVYDAAVEQGLGAMDTGAVAVVLERMAGITRRS